MQKICRNLSGFHCRSTCTSVQSMPPSSLAPVSFDLLFGLPWMQRCSCRCSLISTVYVPDLVSTQYGVADRPLGCSSPTTGSTLTRHTRVRPDILIGSPGPPLPSPASPGLPAPPDRWARRRHGRTPGYLIGPATRGHPLDRHQTPPPFLLIETAPAIGNWTRS